MGKQHDALFAAKLAGSSGGGGGTSDYDDLTDKPQINGTTLSGDKSSTDLGLQSTLSFDSVPTDGSTNPVESNGIYDALAGKLPASTKYGSSIEATPIATAQSQKMNLTLKDQDGNALDTTSFDLPIKDITVNTANNGLNLIYQGGLSKLLYITELISGKVDKIQGKGLSTEDYTTAEKTALAGQVTKTAGIDSTANNYIEMENGLRLYISSTEPTGTIPDGSIWIGGTVSS